MTLSNKKNNFNQRGVSLLVTFFIMIIVLSLVISISSFIYSELKIIRNIGDYTTSYYVAYSGIEKALYYTKDNVCLMYPYNLTKNPKGCPDIVEDKGFFSDDSLYCNQQTVPEVIDTKLNPNGCNVSSCNSCFMSFTTSFDGFRYKVSASAKNNGKIDITSKGTFNNSTRQINVLDASGLK